MSWFRLIKFFLLLLVYIIHMHDFIWMRYLILVSVFRVIFIWVQSYDIFWECQFESFSTQKLKIWFVIFLNPQAPVMIELATRVVFGRLGVESPLYRCTLCKPISLSFTDWTKVWKNLNSGFCLLKLIIKFKDF